MRNRQDQAQNRRAKRTSMKRDYKKALSDLKEIDELLDYKDRMIKNLEESEGQFAEDKVRFEMLYNNTKEQMDYQTRYFIAKENEYKEQLAAAKSDLLFFKAGTEKMFEDIEKLNKDFISYKKLMDINIDKYRA
jgi:adenylosuccinate lyase